VTAVSCVPFMLGNGKRGVVLRLDEKQDQQKIVDLFNNPDQYHRISNAASNWSRQYTTDYFEREIAKLVKQQ
nr:glycosyltransferase family 1 protein [Flavobacterium sp.]